MSETLTEPRLQHVPIVSWLIAAFLLLCAVRFIVNFPLYQEGLFVGFAAFVALLWVKQHAWLFVLPAALPILDLAPWSGWFLIDEFDVLVVLTLAVSLLKVDASVPRIRFSKSFWLFGIFLLWGYLLSFVLGFLPLQKLDGNAWNSYYTNWNALRIGKGFAEGLALAFLLALQRRRNQKLVDAFLLRGLVAGLFVFACVVLWERGLIYDLVYANNIYGALGGVLDFTSPYRITGLFSQMHLGGSAVDGYLVLGCVFPMVLLFKARSGLESAYAFVVMGLVMYAVLVTFTRGTYAAVSLVLLVYFGLLYVRASVQQTEGLNHWWCYLGVFIASSIIMAAGFRMGGSVTLFALSMTLLAGGLYPLVTGLFAHTLRRVGLVFVWGMMFYLAVRGMLNSKYVEVGLFEAIASGLICSLSMVGFGLWLLRSMQRQLGLKQTICALMVLVLAPPVLVIGLMNTRMDIRFGQVSGDLESRTSHWKLGAELMPGDWRNKFFGMGLGAFPRAYQLGGIDESSVGNIWIEEDASGPFLRMVGGSLQIGQRLGEDVVGPVKLQFKARQRSDEMGVLRFRLCQRPLLVQDAWIPACANSDKIDIEPVTDEWQAVQVVLDTKRLSQLDWFSPKFLIFSFSNIAQGSMTDVAEIKLTDAYGEVLLRNGDYEAGSDYWMLFNDFEHLPWHAKNLYLHIYLEQGLWGLLIFGVTVFLSLRASLRLARTGDLLSTGIFASMIGFLALGTVATLFDVPRLVTLFYVLALLPLIRQWTKMRKKHRRRRSRHRSPEMQEMNDH